MMLVFMKLSFKYTVLVICRPIHKEDLHNLMLLGIYLLLVSIPSIFNYGSSRLDCFSILAMFLMRLKIEVILILPLHMPRFIQHILHCGKNCWF